MQHMMYKKVLIKNRAPHTIGELIEMAFRESKGNFCMSLIDGLFSISIGARLFVQGEIEK